MQGEGAVPKGLVRKVLMLVFTLHQGLLKKTNFRKLISFDIVTAQNDNYCFSLYLGVDCLGGVISKGVVHNLLLPLIARGSSNIRVSKTFIF